MATVTGSANLSVGLDNEIEGVGGLASLTGTGAQTATNFSLRSPEGDTLAFTGTGFANYLNGRPTSGTITSVVQSSGGMSITFAELSVPVATFNAAVAAGNDAQLQVALFGGADTITGTPVADNLWGYGGDDLIRGNGGPDFIDGGAGTDTSIYGGRLVDYRFFANASNNLLVQDGRAGAPDGFDTLANIERLQFSDRTVSTAAPNPTAPTSAAWANLVRLGTTGGNAVQINALNDQVAAGQLTQAAAIEQIVQYADASTTVATLAYQFFTGRIPTAAGYNFLVAPGAGNPNNLNSAYYFNFNLENRYINFASNLGKVGEGRANFEANYGSLTLAEATKKAYGAIFGVAPSDAKVSALLDPTFSLNGQVMTRADYFAYYGQDGLSGIGTKAAMVGWLMAEAVKADIGVYARASNAFLTDLADGAAYNVDLIGVYGRPEFAI